MSSMLIWISYFDKIRVKNMAKKGENLVIWCKTNKREDILLEWNYEKNENCNPEDYGRASHAYVWWKCEKGHEWQSRIQSRTEGGGCPICAGKKVLPGYNDLITWAKNNAREDLISEWDYDKNIDLNPQMLSKGSHKKVWWICPQGHSYYSDIHNRTSEHATGCPQCTSSRISKNLKVVLLEKNGSLAEKRPDIAAEWDYSKNNGMTPESITYSCKLSLWWVCPQGHSYYMSLQHRTGMNCGCPYCSNNSHKVLQGFNDLASVYPYLVREWNYEKNYPKKPEDFQAHANVKVWWKGLCGHQWQANIDSRAAGCGCPICAKERTSSFQEKAIAFYLKKIFPNLLCNDKSVLKGIELDIYIPDIRVAVEYDGKKWHEDIERDIRKNEECKKAGIRLFRVRECGLPELKDCICIFVEIRDDNSLNQAINKILGLLNIYDNDTDIVRDRIQIMETFIVSRKNNSLLECFPEIAKEWDCDKNGDLSPDMFSKGSGKKVWWKCPQGHSYQAVIKSRTGPIHSGCRICGAQRAHEKSMKPVLCVETGKVYRSLSEAGASVGATSANIIHACKNKGKSRGYHWKYLDD